jgi:hypothetical protein
MKNGEPVLQDHVQTRLVPKDHGDDDVRQAWAECVENERRERLASDLGSDGVAAVSAWDNRIEQVGPRAALEAAQIYQTAPRPSVAQEESHDDDSWQGAARSAYRSAKQKAERQGNLDHARYGLGQLERKYGTLDVIEDFYLPSHRALTENALDAGPRIATQIQQYIDGANLDAAAAKTVASYGKKISAQERPLMQDILAGGYADNLETAQQMARHELALDVDEFGRGVVAAQRRLERPQMAAANREVAAWRAAVRPSEAEERGVKWLLENGKCETLDEAYKLTKRTMRNGPQRR